MHVFVIDSDFYELGLDGIMEANISVINGSISLSSDLSDKNSSDISMYGSLNNYDWSNGMYIFLNVTCHH